MNIWKLNFKSQKRTTETATRKKKKKAKFPKIKKETISINWWKATGSQMNDWQLPQTTKVKIYYGQLLETLKSKKRIRRMTEKSQKIQLIK